MNVVVGVVASTLADRVAVVIGIGTEEGGVPPPGVQGRSVITAPPDDHLAAGPDGRVPGAGGGGGNGGQVPPGVGGRNVARPRSGIPAGDTASPDEHLVSRPDGAVAGAGCGGRK